VFWDASFDRLEAHLAELQRGAKRRGPS
jgi:hypothetical protein